MVGYIKRLGSELDRLFLPKFKCSNHAQIEPDASRTGNIGSAHRPVRSHCRLDKGSRVEPLIDTFIRRVRRRKHLVRPLVGGLSPS